MYDVSGPFCSSLGGALHVTRIPPFEFCVTSTFQGAPLGPKEKQSAY